MFQFTPVCLLALLWLAGPALLARAAAAEPPREISLHVRPQDLGMQCVHAAPSSGVGIGAFTILLTFPPPVVGSNRSEPLPRVQLSVRLEGEEEARVVEADRGASWQSYGSFDQARYVRYSVFIVILHCD